MARFEIFADSSANLTEEMVEKYNIEMISYTATLNGEEMECYKRGESYEELAKKYYTAIAAGADVKTTLINADKIIDGVEPTLKEGKDVLFVSITTKLSGTYAQALEAQRRLKEKYPDRKFLVVDSQNAGLGQGLWAYYAAKMRDDGKDIDYVKKYLDEHVMYMNSFVYVDSLKYLKKSGRISAAVAIVGGILNIKPVLWGSEKGVLEVLCNEKGKKKALLTLADRFKHRVKDPGNQTIAIAHANNYEDAKALEEMIRAAGAKDVVLNMYDLCTGAHVGPGTVALFFLGKKRVSKKDALS